MGRKDTQKLLVDLMLDFFNKKTKIQKDFFPFLFIWIWAKHIPIWNYSICDNLWNIKLFYLN